MVFVLAKTEGDFNCFIALISYLLSRKKSGAAKWCIETKGELSRVKGNFFITRNRKKLEFFPEKKRNNWISYKELHKHRSPLAL